MWHKKILSSIDMEFYLSDVFKLDGDYLKYTLSAIFNNASSVYDGYCREYPKASGNLARAIKKLGIIPSDYIEPPLTYAIDEVAWAITHGYVHPRDVIVLKYKDNVALLKDISNDILKTLLSTNEIENDPKLVHYLETELNIREATNIESFEDFKVKSIDNAVFTALKTSPGLEAKAAKLLFIPKVEVELENPFDSSGGLSSFRTRTLTSDTLNTTLNEIGNTETRSSVSSIQAGTFLAPLINCTDHTIRTFINRPRRSTTNSAREFNTSLVFKTSTGIRFVKFPAAILNDLESRYNLQLNNAFMRQSYTEAGTLNTLASRGVFDELIEFDNVDAASGFFANCILTGEDSPASGVEEVLDNV